MISYPVRIALVAVSGVFGAWCLFLVLTKVARPYVLGHDEGRKVAILRTRLSSINTENEALRHQITYLQSPEGAESEARHKGYHRPGEIVYLISDSLLSSDTVPAKDKAISSPAFP